MSHDDELIEVDSPSIVNAHESSESGGERRSVSDYMGGVHAGKYDFSAGLSGVTSFAYEKSVVFDDVAAQTKIRLYDSSITPMGRPPESFAEWQVDIRHGDVTLPRLRWTEPLRAEMEHFLACARGEAECLVPGAECRGSKPPVSAGL